MPVRLCKSSDLPLGERHDRWCAAGDCPCAPDSTPPLHGQAERLEAAFDAIRDEWWALGRELASLPGGELAHMPTSGTYSSDFGVMAAWARLVEELAGESPLTLVVCDDPWLYRQLALIPGVSAARPPAILMPVVMLRLRGWASRARVALRMALASRSSRGSRRNWAPGGTWILVYGHPQSDGAGGDAYFGDLMGALPNLKRLMHTDCPVTRAAELAADGRTASLHAWAAPGMALRLILARWRPAKPAGNGPYDWLVERSAEMEGSGGSAAMTRWQIGCQEKWLDEAQPTTVAWPWENHPWERMLVRAARRRGVRTIGYQHTVIGPHMYNQSPSSNHDQLDSIPDLIICNSRATLRHLAEWGMPRERMTIGGAFRLKVPEAVSWDPQGPVFVALSSQPPHCRQMLAAIRPLAEKGVRFLVKEHPMYPFPFEPSENICPTERPLADQTDIRAVLYSTGTIGLESYFSGLPTLRFRPRGLVAMNVMPLGIEAVPVDANGLGHALENLERPESAPQDYYMAPVEMDIWRHALGEDV